MMCRLSDKTIDDILGKGRIYEVGGAVRDRLIDVHTVVKDRDYLVTGLSYSELSKLLKSHGRVDLVGRSFGVIKFTQFKDGNPHTFDITLPRLEQSTGAGHREFEVNFDPSITVEDDLTRRDFTINAMAFALDSKELIDPLGGMVDLKNRQLRMTSERSFEEDPLRMLRAVQFAARFEFDIEPETLKSMTRHSHKIATVSPERVNEELSKLLTLANSPSIGFRLMEQTQLLRVLFPELQKCVGVEQPGGYHKYEVFEHIIRTVDACKKSLRLRLAALFHDITKPQTKRLTEKKATFYGHETSGAKIAVRVLEKYRYPKELIKEVRMLVERHMFTTGVSDKGLRRLVRRVGVDLIFDLLDLRRADVIAQGMGGTTEDVDEFQETINLELEKKPPFGYSDLKIGGNEIMKMFKIPPSAIVGELLEYLMDKVIDDPENNTIETLVTLAQNHYQSLTEKSTKPE